MFIIDVTGRNLVFNPEIWQQSNRLPLLAQGVFRADIVAESEWRMRCAVVGVIVEWAELGQKRG